MAHAFSNKLFSNTKIGSKLALVAAILGIVGNIGLVNPVSAATDVPTTRQDCRNWRDYDQFKNRGDCVSYVSQHHGQSGYGGGNGGGNSGNNDNIVTVITRLFSFLSNIFAALFTLIGRLF